VKALAYLAGTLVVVLIAATAFVAWTVQRSFPDYAGDVTLPGLHSEVRVLRDAHGIPQIYADNSDDLFFAQGLVQAQDRFFEMDFRRHVTSGRLSELFGADTLQTDMLVRTLGWRRVAEQELELLTPSTRGYLDAYAAGVNAYLADHSGARLSLEYAVLSLDGVDYTPEPWTAVDSLSWLKAMAWDLRGNMEEEVDRVLAATRLPRRMVAELYPPYPASPRTCRHCWGRAMASGRTRGRSRVHAPTPESRCLPTTRTSPRPCPVSGTRWACTARLGARLVPSTSRGSRSQECPAS
jgi:penicillin amidase